MTPTTPDTPAEPVNPVHECRAERPMPRDAMPHTRIIRCGRPAGHAGVHEETGTEVTWANARPPRWGHWDNPVIYMSRRTAREVWHLLYGVEPDLLGDLRFGQSQIPVLFDDRMELGAARLEEDPDPPTTPQATWPAHLRDDAPHQQCTGCGRKTWDTEHFGQPCWMPQPGGVACDGRFEAVSTGD